MDTNSIARFLVLVGIIIIVIGALFWIGGKMGLPLGNLPGDIKVSKEKYGFYFPIVTSIVISIVLTIIVNFILWIMRK
jgi:hypothetical protein